MSSLCLAFRTSRLQGFWPLLGSCRLKASRFLASLVAFASSRLQGFWPSLGRWKLKVSRFLAFSWPLQAQGFKVSGLFLAWQAQGFKVSGLFLALQAQGFKVSSLFLAFASSRLQGFWPFLSFCKLKASRFLAFSWPLQAQGFKVFAFGGQNSLRLQGILELRASSPPSNEVKGNVLVIMNCYNEFVLMIMLLTRAPTCVGEP